MFHFELTYSYVNPSTSQEFQANKRVYASKSSPKKLRKAKEAQKIVNPRLPEGAPDEQNEVTDKSPSTDSINNLESQASVAIASRSSVLQACTVTSGLIAFVGIILRQVKSSFATIFTKMKHKTC